MNSSEQFLQIGMALAASQRGLTNIELVHKQAAEEVMDSPEAEPYHRELCKLAYAAFETDGATATPEAQLFLGLAKSAEWHTEFHNFTACVERALSKQAAILPAAAMLHDKAGGGVLKTLAATGALGGAALGSLAFLAARNANQTSADNAQTLEKIKAYKRLRRDIEEDMAAEGVMNDEEENQRFNV